MVTDSTFLEINEILGHLALQEHWFHSKILLLYVFICLQIPVAWFSSYGHAQWLN